MNRTQRKIKKEYRESLEELKVIKDSDLYELRHNGGIMYGITARSYVGRKESCDKAFKRLKLTVQEERDCRKAMRFNVSRAKSKNKEAATI